MRIMTLGEMGGREKELRVLSRGGWSQGAPPPPEGGGGWMKLIRDLRDKSREEER